MEKIVKVIFAIVFFASNTINAQSQMDSGKIGKKFQAKAPKTVHFGKEAFVKTNTTIIRWLGMAGFFVNSRGQNFMIDPLLEGYDLPLLMDFPIQPN